MGPLFFLVSTIRNGMFSVICSNSWFTNVYECLFVISGVPSRETVTVVYYSKFYHWGKNRIPSRGVPRFFESRLSSTLTSGMVSRLEGARGVYSYILGREVL